jgi:AcrR family transcriptional regulator
MTYIPTDKNINKKNGSRENVIPRRRRSPAASRENILVAAEAILTARGPLHLKLTEVAAEAGVATATVLHHFGAIDGVQAALMERMVTRLAARVIAITAAAAPDQVAGPEADIALFDAFEEQGAARLAAWLVMTGEATRLSAVKRAVDDVVDMVMSRLSVPPARTVIEDIVLASITVALGAGLFGQPLSVLLGRAPDAARKATLDALAAYGMQAGLI